MKSCASMVLLASFFYPALSLAQASGCDAKRQAIESEISYAESHGNTSRVKGLQKALAEVKDHCTDASLRRASEQKVVKAQEKLAERERELQVAKEQGKSQSKISDRQRKVDEAHADLERAMMEASP
ncbi:DUF1090 domain-containing protein [Luteibacter sp. RCC_6_2]|uniref:DUF1090 domain-containing protein n=1 Tax=Luteibacter sp. RCC_6_2 TaxID=3239223 RepID=UPI003525651A